MALSLGPGRSLTRRGARDLCASQKSAEPDLDKETEDRLDHNELLIDAMKENLEEFRRLKTVVEVPLEVPVAWWNEVVAHRMDRIAESAALTPEMRVLDIGTGTGTMIEHLCKPGRCVTQ